MSQSSRSRFQSKLPRPVVRPSTLNECNFPKPKQGLQAKEKNKKDSKRVCEDIENESKSNIVSTSKLTEKPLQEGKQLCEPDGIASEQTEVKNEMDCPEDDFQADPKALESILSNKLITDELLSSRPSTAYQLQGIRKSSMYYQSPSRMSMIDSHTQFMENMKLLKKQMKSLNMKSGGTLKENHEKTTNNAVAARPASLYYQMKPLQRKPSTPTHTTPVASHIRLSSMSEKKFLKPSDCHNNRLCHTVSKLDSKPKPSGLHQHRPATGKENKVRFKLFPSPIHEVSESASPQSNGNPISNVMVTTSLKSCMANQNVWSMSEESNVNHGTSMEQLRLRLESTPSTPMSLPSDRVNFSYSTHHTTNTNMCPPVMSTSTISTWTISNSICTPTSVVFTPVKPKATESATPPQQITHEMKNTLAERSQANTPSRIICNSNRSQHKAPQRTLVDGSVRHGAKLPGNNPYRTTNSFNSVRKFHTKSPLV